MNEKVKLKIGKMLLLAAKIAVGSSAAIYIAEMLHLQNVTSAGTITMLTLITTKWGTVRLSLQRLVTFVISVIVCWCAFHLIQGVWLEFGVFLFCMVLVSEYMGWRSTLSVNAVIGIHLLNAQDFSIQFLCNELLLVVIGISLALVLNLIHINNAQEMGIISSMRYVEHEMKEILIELAGYLSQKASGDCVWDDLIKLEAELDEYLELAYEYHNNTFQSHQEYYIAYFEMRMKQCGALHNLHAEMKRMREMPKQAHVVSEYIYSMAQHVTEMNDPKKQMNDLEELLDNMRNDPLPETRKEFESRAELYHTLMDLEEFLMYKKRFVESIDATQFRIYWKKEIEGK